MPLSYPIAPTARAALDAGEEGARTISEARDKAGRGVTLVSEWLRPQPAEREAMQGKADAGVTRGYVQLYEDAKGRPVIAVTYWKPQAAPDKTRASRARAKGVSATRTAPSARQAAPADTVDDLYFEKPPADGWKSPAGRRKTRNQDPRQLDLFSGPDQQGAEHLDPHNPSVVIVDEEGDGAAFGLAPSDMAAKRSD